MHLRDTFQLDPTVTFLNHGSFGACPTPVFAVYQQIQREVERQPVDFFGRRVRGLLAEARQALGAYLHVAGDDLTFVTNATMGINTVAKSLPLRPGDEILTSDHEYGAINMTWGRAVAQSGAKIVTYSPQMPLTTPDAFINGLWEHVTPNTRVIALSHITSPTALIFPIKEICHKARAAGIWTVIDGAHAVSQLPLDLTDIAPDFYTGNHHKWLCAPKGSGFLYVRQEHQAMIQPLTHSWESEDANPFHQRHEWHGTEDVSQHLAVPAAIAFQNEHNWSHIRQECHTLLMHAREEIAALGNNNSLAEDPGQWFAQMGAFPLPSRELADYHRLWPEFNVEIPVFQWQNHILCRVSIQAYNTEDDVHRLVTALKTIIQ